MQKKWIHRSNIISGTTWMLLLLIGLYQPVVCAQEHKNKPDSITAYILRYDTVVNIKLNVNTEFDQFEVKGTNFRYDIRPNISYSSKLSFSYRYISFSLGFTPGFIQSKRDIALQGKTKTLSFQVDVVTNHLLQNLQYIKAKGFYLHNTSDFNPNFNPGTDPYIQLPSLKVVAIRGLTGYKINPNYSLQAISTQTEKQLRSCGSFIPCLNYDYYITDNMTADSHVSSSQRSTNLAVQLSVGYMYTLVMNKRFFVSLGFLPGVGMQYSTLLTRMPTENITTHSVFPAFRLAERIGLRYNNDRIYAGTEVSLAQSLLDMQTVNMWQKLNRTYFQAFIGFRFEAPTFLKQSANFVKSKIPQSLQSLIE